jgi:Fe2+ or Zn2+ uptake regulation protein
MSRADHPSAVEVFLRVKARVPSISLATVYNCLENLAATGQVRMVNHDREPSRYCANLTEHAHLFCSVCGSVTDLPALHPVPPEQIWHLPEGVVISQQEVSFRGICAGCAEDHHPRLHALKSPNTPGQSAYTPGHETPNSPL